MGQQQLILLVLATVIVGVAIVVGIRAFTENSAKANVDAMTQDAIRMANDAQAWKKKPAPFGGQPEGATKTNPANFSDLPGFLELGYAEATGGATKYQNVNGCFTIVPGTGNLTIIGVNDVENNEVRIIVDGITDTDIAPVAGYPLLTTSSATNDCGTAPTTTTN